MAAAHVSRGAPTRPALREPWEVERRQTEAGQRAQSGVAGRLLEQQREQRAFRQPEQEQPEQPERQQRVPAGEYWEAGVGVGTPAASERSSPARFRTLRPVGPRVKSSAAHCRERLRPWRPWRWWAVRSCG
jgi:hypothetical protein